MSYPLRNCGITRPAEENEQLVPQFSTLSVDSRREFVERTESSLSRNIPPFKRSAARLGGILNGAVNDNETKAKSTSGD